MEIQQQPRNISAEYCRHTDSIPRCQSVSTLITWPLTNSPMPLGTYQLTYVPGAFCFYCELTMSLSVDSGVSAASASVNGGGGRAAGVDKGVDFANYFCSYAFLYHQKEMLSDRVRMDGYYNAIFQNKHHFQRKTVLDVGTGSGILAIWSAQAGARKVYAVEAAKMAEHTRELVKANNVQDVVEVIEGSMEEITLPEKVDVIISEWMGYFLLRESMFDSVIFARDRWLKPDGVMYPSHARMWLAPIRSGFVEAKQRDYEEAMDDWFGFVDETKSYYGVDMDVLTKPFTNEQSKYFLQTSLWNNLHPNQVIGTPAILMEMDCLKATVRKQL